MNNHYQVMGRNSVDTWMNQRIILVAYIFICTVGISFAGVCWGGNCYLFFFLFTCGTRHAIWMTGTGCFSNSVLSLGCNSQLILKLSQPNKVSVCDPLQFCLSLRDHRLPCCCFVKSYSTDSSENQEESAFIWNIFDLSSYGNTVL